MLQIISILNSSIIILRNSYRSSKLDGIRLSIIMTVLRRDDDTETGFKTPLKQYYVFLFLYNTRRCLLGIKIDSQRWKFGQRKHINFSSSTTKVTVSDYKVTIIFVSIVSVLQVHFYFILWLSEGIKCLFINNWFNCLTKKFHAFGKKYYFYWLVSRYTERVPTSATIDLDFLTSYAWRR